MSLTREEWEQVYNSAKKIEQLSNYLYFSHRLCANELRREAEFIKSKVEQVIGQME